MFSMMGLFFLVVCAVGILRPIRNALALDGLAQTDFYKVYLVSAVVVAFVPAYNRLSNRWPWRWLIPAVALFFATNLLVFRALYVEGSTAFGLMFYGWYDLFAAALVTQFFMATQLFFDARLARRAYPLVIAGGSIGATLGGAITGFFAERVGTPNLMLVAAALIALFSVGIPIIWATDPPFERQPGKRRAKLSRGDLTAIAANRQVRLIAGMVLITILTKQLIDYEFNTLTKVVFVERDAISAFQGKFNAATQWLPIVALAALQPLLRRFGVGVAVLLLPVAMLLTGTGLLLFFGLWAAVAAKAAETSLRYSAERAGREILYVPIPDEIKLKAKTYIDVAVEKGVGKVTSAGLIFVLLLFMDYRWIPAVAVVLAAFWVAMALSVRREYVRALSGAMEGRFASLRGVFATLADASTAPVLEKALQGDARQATFALDLIEQSPLDETTRLVPILLGATGHASARVRARALDLLTRVSPAVDVEVVRDRVCDPDPDVREAAVRLLAAARQGQEAEVYEDLLARREPEVRTAALACLVRGEVAGGAVDVARRIYGGRGRLVEEVGGEDARIEMALAAGALGGGPDAVRILSHLLDDDDARVSSTALYSAAHLHEPTLFPKLVDGLAHRGTRVAARDALVSQGDAIVPLLVDRLLARNGVEAVRRNIPSVLARIPSPDSVHALIRCAVAPETEQILDYRALKALSKLRARNPDLAFDAVAAWALLDREVSAAARFGEAHASLRGARAGGPAVALLARALLDAWAERREGAFRVLGLLFPPDDVYRCYLAVVRGDRVSRANALEWLETTLGYHQFGRLAPVLGPEPTAGVTEDAARVLDSLRREEDNWLARCAEYAARELAAGPAAATGPRSAPMDPVETVLLLQSVDVLRDAKSAHLALLASIAEEIDADVGTVLVREGEPADALYVIVRGKVSLRGRGSALEAGEGEAFGAWALIEEAPSVVEAKVTAPSHLLRVNREEFYDLMSEYPELAIGLMQGLARRMRTLVA